MPIEYLGFSLIINNVMENIINHDAQALHGETNGAHTYTEKWHINAT
jgi:hypothetical protein